MPQASDELRKKWNGPDDTTAIKYLESRGYKLTRGWDWELPEGQNKPTDEELSAIEFMFQEWDYGGWVRRKKEK